MIEVHPRLWVGNDNDASRLIEMENVSQDARGRYIWEYERGASPVIWAMVSAAKEPYHRSMVGYTGRAAPEGPLRFSVRRGRHLALNWVDVDDPEWFREAQLREAFEMIDAAQLLEIDCLVHCNQGVSRSPALVLGWLHENVWDGLSFDRSEEKFKGIYPQYDPTAGVREFVRRSVR